MGSCHSPAGDSEAQLTHAVQQSRGLLEEGRHLGTLVHRALDRQEAAVQLVNQTHVDHVAERKDKEFIWSGQGKKLCKSAMMKPNITIIRYTIIMPVEHVSEDHKWPGRAHLNLVVI